MSRHDQRRKIERQKQSPRVVINFLSRGVRAHESYIRLQPCNFAFDIVRVAEGGDLHSVEPDQKSDDTSLHKIFEAQGP